MMLSEEEILSRYSKRIKKLDNNNFYFLDSCNKFVKHVKTSTTMVDYHIHGKIIHIDTQGSVTLQPIKTDDPFQEALDLFGATLDLDEEVFYEPL